MSQTDVLIIGAGPTGLTLALWLQKQGVGVRIIDYAEAPSKNSRAVAVHARVLELYHQIDLADELNGFGYPLLASNIWIDGKHYATVPLSDFGKKLTPYPYMLMLSQEDHEKILEKRLQSLGIYVERRTKLKHYVEHGSKITATLVRETDCSEIICDASWIVGCDGARSIVRHEIGADFQGETYDPLFYIADVEAGPGDYYNPGFNGEAHIRMLGEKYNVILPFSNGKRIRLIGTMVPESYQQIVDLSNPNPQLKFEDVEPEIRAVTGIEIKKLHCFSTYRCHHRIADRFRKGRAFIAGDAAHIHSPVGGQGMNTGIMDAANLAWKLAAVIKNPGMSEIAQNKLLDSYEIERRTFAMDVIGATDQGFTMLTSKGLWPYFVRQWLLPYGVPIFTKLEYVKHQIFRRGSQLICSYRGSHISQAASGWGAVQPGDRLPWANLDSGDNFSLLRHIAWQLHVYGYPPEDLEKWCIVNDVLLTVIDWDPHHGKVGLKKNAVYLLRPDQYIAGIFEGQSVNSMLNDYFSSRELTY
ncbi:hypothetical protein N7488_005043 [Penicillium malachiteum]|nr:hypothetical protein N7488_005043 [Penicillium malachiteum]